MDKKQNGQVLRVVVVDDDIAVRDALSQAIAAIDNFRIVGEAASLEEGIEQLALAFDIILIDLNLGDGSGIELIRLARVQKPDVKIVVISVFGDERNVISAIEAGADGYLLKDISDIDLTNALNRIISEEYPISPSIAGHLLKRVRTADPKAKSKPNNFQLTQRETEILKLLAKGYTYQEVSNYLSISYHTVADYIRNIYKKLSVNSKSQAIFEAAQAGIIQVNDPYNP